MAENACAQFQYAVKFVCGEAGEQGIVAPGQYFTAINIHNPSSTRQVKFQWKIAIAPPGVKGGSISKFFDAALKPDQALEIDCPDITRRTEPSHFRPLKGFVVIISPCELDVVAVYTAQQKRGAGVQTMHMERVPARMTCC